MSYKDFLEKEIKKTGFPLEIKISSFLDDKWHSVVNTDTYYDSDEGKLRDIDIHAADYLESSRVMPISLRTGLVIECKKTENFAWVFFTRPFKMEMEDIDGQYVDEIQCVTKNTENYQIMETIFEKSKLHYENVERIAVAYDEFYRKGKKSSNGSKKKVIFEAQNQLKKFIGVLIDQTIRADPQFEFFPIEIYFPCIVLDGLMFEAIIDKDEIRLAESNHIILRSFYRSPYSVYERAVLIDVVQQEYFNDYHKIVRKNVTTLRRTVRNHAKKFIREIDQAASIIRSTRTKT